MKALLQRAGRIAFELVYPRFCQFCGRRHCHKYAYLCDECLAQIPLLSGAACKACGLPAPDANEDLDRCPNCRDLEASADRVVCGVRLRGLSRSILHRFKYQRQLYWRALLADFLAAAVDVRAPGEAELLVPVPLHRRRKREREYNQSEILARDLGTRLGLEVERQALRRVRDTSTQTALGRAERLANLHGAFEPLRTEKLAGRSVGLVDDVLTTGATTEACARILRRAGAKKVLVFTVARG